MGMSFEAQGAPYKMVDCLCKQYGDECPSYCDGKMREYESPNLAMPYSKATALIDSVGIEWGDDRCHAYLKPEDMPRILRNIMKVSNLAKARSHFDTRDTEIKTGAKGARFIRCGDTHEMWLERLRDLQKLIKYCHERNLALSMA